MCYSYPPFVLQGRGTAGVEACSPGRHTAYGATLSKWFFLSASPSSCGGAG